MRWQGEGRSALIIHLYRCLYIYTDVHTQLACGCARTLKRFNQSLQIPRAGMNLACMGCGQADSVSECLRMWKVAFRRSRELSIA